MYRLQAVRLLLIFAVFSGTSVAQDALPTPNIEVLQGKYIEACEIATKAFSSEIDTLIGRLKKSSQTKMDEQLKVIRELENQKEALANNSKPPTSHLANKAFRRLLTAEQSANSSFLKGAKKLARDYRNLGKFEDAYAALSAEANRPLWATADRDPLIDTKWHYFGSNSKPICLVELFKDGTANSKDDRFSSWKRLDETTILLSYAGKSEYIAFHEIEDGVMRGFTSSRGLKRRLQKAIE